eukprot:scaffold18493_cov135-Skeletonema_dohrnii-CCMP3373.AAC.3
MSSGGEGSSVKQSKKKKSGNGSGNNDDVDDDEGKSNARGSVLLVEQILQENEQGGGKRNKPLWQELKDLYTPTKSKQNDQFDMNGEDDCEEVVMEDGQKIIVSKCGGCDKSRGCRWCLVALTTLVIVVGAVACLITFPPNTASLKWKKAMSGMRDWKSSSSNNNNVVQQQLLLQQQQQQGRGQEMLELAEQITLACGESSLLRSGSVSSGGGVDARSGISTCQELCHNHMCCVEQDDEYSCKNDLTKDCAVYAGCVALIDDNFW